MLIDGRVPYDMAIWGEYFKRAEYHRRHHVRYKAYVKAYGLVCQECVAGRPQAGEGGIDGKA